MKTHSRGLIVTSAATATTLLVFVGQASATTKLATTTTAKRTSTAHSYKSGQLSIDAAGQATCKKGNQFTATATWSLGKVTKSSAYIKQLSVKYTAPIAGKSVNVGRINLVNGNNKVVYGTDGRYVVQVKGGTSTTQTYPIKKTVTFNNKQIQFRRYFEVNTVGTEAQWCGGTAEFAFILKSRA
ncbi:hypothetical protein [Streptomyces sp. NBC_00078]|uniref:hypothetical protein n=1 Tax=unclassified Streptomyces TaxID=2593676 RepID=UPI002258A2F2|nr:hypothetical protein [Streptomyces sp. NBC_00078]MCX5423392.1 hypothetical protein [Streptomyces sp. NBC_00078]